MIALNPEPPAEPDSDISLMLRVQEDDRVAFDRLVTRHRERAVRLIMSMSIEPHLAEDLAQDLFVRVYQARKRYLPTAQFSTWIGAIARHLVLNAHRDGARRRSEVSHDGLLWHDRRGDALPPPRVGCREPDPAESAVAEERRQALRAAMRRLNERERAAVALFHFGGKSYQAVARQIGSTPKAVKSLLARARAKLRESMAGSPVAAELLEERPTTGRRGGFPSRRSGPESGRSF